MIGSDPFFIVYDARSGSTLLARLLTEKIAVSIPPESNFLTDLFEAFDPCELIPKSRLPLVYKILSNDPKFGDWGIEVDAIDAVLSETQVHSPAAISRQLLQIYKEKAHPDAVLSGIKKGSYLRAFEQIRQVFPGSRFLFLIRDGRAVFNSKKRSIYSATGRPFESNPARAAEIWVNTVKTMRRLSGCHDGIMIVYYERLICSTDDTLGQIGDFLEVRANKSNAGRLLVPERYGKNLHQYVFSEPIQEKISAWRKQLYLEEIKVYQSIAGDELAALGCDPVAV